MSPCVRSLVTFGRWSHGARDRRSKTTSCVSHRAWNRPGNSTDMTPGTLDCQLASPLVSAKHRLDKWIYLFIFASTVKTKGRVRTRGLVFHRGLGHSRGAVKTSTWRSNALYKYYWEKVHNLLDWLRPPHGRSLVDGSLCSKNKCRVLGSLLKPKLLRPSVSPVFFDALTSLCYIISKSWIILGEQKCKKNNTTNNPRLLLLISIASWRKVHSRAALLFSAVALLSAWHILTS